MVVYRTGLTSRVQGWQRKLTQLNVAAFPWDADKPKEPPAANPQSAHAGQAVPAYAQSQLSPAGEGQLGGITNMPLPPVGQAANGVPVKQEPLPVKQEPLIKQEPGLHNVPMPPAHPYVVGGGAAARAVQNLQNTFGQRAAASISTIHSEHGQGTHPGPQQGGRPIGAVPIHNSQQYRSQVVQSTQQRAPQAALNGAGGLPRSQVDGAGDAFEGVLTRRDPDGKEIELGRLEIDSMLHEHIASRAKQMEGGGLMLPLKQATKHKSIPTAGSRAGVPRVDGAEDEAKDPPFDEDAINSDLDDPDEEGDDDDDEDETMGPIMLCMYDKVQRVKNKWCVPGVAISPARDANGLVGSALSRTAFSTSTARNTSSTRPRASTSGNRGRADRPTALVVGQSRRQNSLSRVPKGWYSVLWRSYESTSAMASVWFDVRRFPASFARVRPAGEGKRIAQARHPRRIRPGRPAIT